MIITQTNGKKIYHYKQCGLDSVYLLNGFTEHKTEYGNAISFKNVKELHKAISLVIIRQEGKLSGKEFRFLRKELELTQEQLAKYLGFTVLEINRWENEKNKLNPACDRLIRLLYIEHSLGNPHILQLMQDLQDMQENKANIKFQLKKEGWAKAA